MKLKTLFWLHITGILAVALCSCSDDKNETTSKLGDSTSPELSEKFNSFNVLSLPLDSIRAINGMTALEVDTIFWISTDQENQALYQNIRQMTNC